MLDMREDVNNSYFYLEFLYTETAVADGSESSEEYSWGVNTLPGDCTEVLDLLVSYGLAENVSELLYDNE